MDRDYLGRIGCDIVGEYVGLLSADPQRDATKITGKTVSVRPPFRDGPPV